MSPLTTSETIAALALALSILVFIVSAHKDSRSEAARDQLVNDKLDRSVELAKETRDTVREMSRKLDDHSQVLARHAEQISALDRRVGAIEQRCERHFEEGQDE